MGGKKVLNGGGIWGGFGAPLPWRRRCVVTATKGGGRGGVTWGGELMGLGGTCGAAMCGAGMHMGLGCVGHKNMGQGHVCGA